MKCDYTLNKLKDNLKMKNFKYKFIITLIISIFLSGCMQKQPQIPQAVSFTVISPMVKLSDAGFLRVYKNSVHLQIYSSGVSVLEIVVKDRICMNNACKDELAFNKDFFTKEHYRGFFDEILRKKPIYNGKNLVKTECGFEQNLRNLSYKVCGKELFFKDKNDIKIILKDID